MVENVAKLDAGGIEVKIASCPTTITGADGTRRGEDEVMVIVEDFEDYETDLVQNGDITLCLTKKQAVELAHKLIDSAMADFDELFINLFPDVYPIKT